jgi:hypothetical protein
LIALAQNGRTGPSSECGYPNDGLARPPDARPPAQQPGGAVSSL